MFVVAITNSFILCKHHTDLSIQASSKTFCVELGKSLIRDYCSTTTDIKEVLPGTLSSLWISPKTTAATTAIYTGKSGMKQSGFVGTMDTSYVIMDLRKTIFTFTNTYVS